MPAEARLDDCLRNAIVAYCLSMEPDSLDDLADDVRQGDLGWFRDEFAAAIVSGVLTPDLWGRLIQTGLDEDDTTQLHSDLREIWARIAPDQPFPAAE
jgi:hypothetical protein